MMTISRTHTGALAASLFLAGCAAPAPKPKPPLPREELPPLTEVALPNEANVRFPGVVKAYAVNRYIDPSNPNLMHERGVVYRAEESPHWKLDSRRHQQVIVGPVLTDSRMERQPAPLARELVDELRKTRAVNESYRNVMEKALVTNQQMLKAVGNLAQATDELSGRVSRVEFTQVRNEQGKTQPVSAPPPPVQSVSYPPPSEPKVNEKGYLGNQ